MQKAHYILFSSPNQRCALATLTQKIDLCIFLSRCRRMDGIDAIECEACGAWLPESKWFQLQQQRRVRTEHSLHCAQPAEIHFEHYMATLWQTRIQHRRDQGQSLPLLFSQTVTALRHGRFHLSRSDSEWWLVTEHISSSRVLFFLLFFVCFIFSFSSIYSNHTLLPTLCFISCTRCTDQPPSELSNKTELWHILSRES